jgi:hypothetical protein
MKKDKPARKGLTATESIEAQALRQVRDMEQAAGMTLAQVAELQQLVQRQQEYAQALGMPLDDFMRLVQQVEQWEPFARWARDEHDERIAGELVQALHDGDAQAADAWFVEYGDEMRPALVAAIIDSALNRGVKQAREALTRSGAEGRTAQAGTLERWELALDVWLEDPARWVNRKPALAAEISRRCKQRMEQAHSAHDKHWARWDWEPGSIRGWLKGRTPETLAAEIANRRQAKGGNDLGHYRD